MSVPPVSPVSPDAYNAINAIGISSIALSMAVGGVCKITDTSVGQAASLALAVTGIAALWVGFHLEVAGKGPNGGCALEKFS